MLPEEREAFFKEKLFAMYDECKKYLVPKTKYYMMMSYLKMASEDPHKKVRQNYYILSKLEILLCGDVEKLIKKRAESNVQSLYYMTIEDTIDIIKRAQVCL